MYTISYDKAVNDPFKLQNYIPTSILVGNQTRLIVQGFTEAKNLHAEQMIAYGTPVVGGVTPGKGVQKHLDLPFNTVKEAVLSLEGANTTVIFVPPVFAADAITEAAFLERSIICITEGSPSMI